MFNITDRYLHGGWRHHIGSVGYCAWLNRVQQRHDIQLYTRLTILVARGASPPA